MTRGMHPYTKSKNGNVTIHDWLDLENGYLGWNLPGHGSARNNCGTFRNKGCLEVDRHAFSQDLEGNVHHGKVFIRRIKHSCGKAGCPICYESWAAKESHKIDWRFKTYQTWLIHNGKRSYNPIHVSVSVPTSVMLRYNNYKKFRKVINKLLKRAGIFAYCMIPHPFRESEDKRWYFSWHFHVIGYGWVRNTENIYKDTGIVITNIGVRESVFHTAMYQLSHAGVHNNYHTITWGGGLSYNKFKCPKLPEPEDKCPICNRALQWVVWSGDGQYPVKDIEGDYLCDPGGWMYQGDLYDT